MHQLKGETDMKLIVYLMLVLIIPAGISLAQDQYPKYYEAGTKIELTPQKNVYIITETQLDSCLKINELFKNCEQRIELLKLKIAGKDSIITLLRKKEFNFDSTLTSTRQKLDNITDEAEKCQKNLVKQNWYKKTFIGIAGLEAIALLLILAL